MQIMGYESKIADIHLQVRRIHNKFSPIHRLPTELLVYVFGLAIDHQTNRSDWSSLRTYTAVILASICRYWRQIALSSATLWSHIIVKSRPETKSSGTRSSYPVEFAEICLSRSKTASIQVEIYDEHANDFNTWSRVFSVHSSRIKGLRLEVNMWALDMLRWDMPNLMDLAVFPTTTVDIDDSKSDAIYELPIMFYGNLPNLY